MADSKAKVFANSCTELKKLNLQCNAFSNEGAVSIVNAIKHYSKGYLCCARISEEGQAKVFFYDASKLKLSSLVEN